MNTVPVAGVLAKGGEAAKAGPIGLVVILLLCVASYFLFRSMSRHLRNVRENFPGDGGTSGGPGASGSAAEVVDPDRTGTPSVSTPEVAPPPPDSPSPAPVPKTTPGERSAQGPPATGLDA